METTKENKPKEKIIICDLDGCLIDSEWIWSIINGMKLEKEVGFDMFNRLANAEANEIDLTLLNYLRFKNIAGVRILFLTARSEIIETETINFIQRKTGLIFGKDFSISSRPSTDLTPAIESKRARLRTLIDSGKEILIAIDDEIDIVEMYEQAGIKAMQWSIGFVPVMLATEFGSQLPGLLGIKEAISQN